MSSSIKKKEKIINLYSTNGSVAIEILEDTIRDIQQQKLNNFAVITEDKTGGIRFWFFGSERMHYLLGLLRRFDHLMQEYIDDEIDSS